jgi:hypothetical protein
LPDQWNESIIVPIHKKGDKTGCSTRNYREILLLSTSYKTLSNILHSKLSPYIDAIIGDHQCGFQCNRSITDLMFCIRQILEKKGRAIHRHQESLLSVWRGVLYSIHIEFGLPMKLVRLIKMCLNETYSKVQVGKHLPDNFPIQNGLK